MGMNQPSPEILAQFSQQQQPQPEQPMEGEMPPMGEMDGGIPPMGDIPMGEEDMMGMNALADSMQPEEVDVPFDPMMLVEEVISEYAQSALRLAQREDLDAPVQSRSMLEYPQALSTLVPLLKNDTEIEMSKMQMEMEVKQQELELRKQEAEMNLQTKQAEMEMKREEHTMKLELSQAENQLKLQQQQETHQHNLVQSQEQHRSKIEQQKQAAQLKQSSNSGNNQPKK